MSINKGVSVQAVLNHRTLSLNKGQPRIPNIREMWSRHAADNSIIPFNCSTASMLQSYNQIITLIVKQEDCLRTILIK